MPVADPEAIGAGFTRAADSQKTIESGPVAMILYRLPWFAPRDGLRIAAPVFFADVMFKSR
jgi:hypothetical protein